MKKILSKIITLKDEKGAGYRLDVIVSALLPSYSRNKIQEYIEEGYILVNQKKVKASYKISLNDEISVYEFPKEITELQAENIDFDVVFEDNDVIVINKPRGLIVHPGAGNKNGTLANGLAGYSENLSDVSGEFRPGIVHRIDKDTTGLLVVAKNNEAHNKLAEQLKDHSLSRKYIALVQGVIGEEEGKIIAPIGRDKKNRLKMAVDVKNGKEAITDFKVIKRFHDYTLVECSLHTGRTHQIRVHFDYINHPVMGDPLYGKGNRVDPFNFGQLLHAKELTFVHPRTNKKVTFEAPLPSDFNDILDSLNLSDNN